MKNHRPTEPDPMVYEKVKEIVVQLLGIAPDTVTLKAAFTEDLGADSLDTVEIVMAFEEKFEIEIPDEDAEKIATVEDAVWYIMDASANGQGPK